MVLILSRRPVLLVVFVRLQRLSLPSLVLKLAYTLSAPGSLQFSWKEAILIDAATDITYMRVYVCTHIYVEKIFMF